MAEPDDEGPGTWVDKTAFVMPVLPPTLEVDPVFAGLLHCMAFLELSGDEDVDPDWAVEAMEHVSHYLQGLAKDQQVALSKQLERIVAWAKARGESEEFITFVQDFLVNVGVGEADHDE